MTVWRRTPSPRHTRISAASELLCTIRHSWLRPHLVRELRRKIAPSSPTRRRRRFFLQRQVIKWQRATTETADSREWIRTGSAKSRAKAGVRHIKAATRTNGTREKPRKQDGSAVSRPITRTPRSTTTRRHIIIAKRRDITPTATRISAASTGAPPTSTAGWRASTAAAHDACFAAMDPSRQREIASEGGRASHGGRGGGRSSSSSRGDDSYADDRSSRMSSRGDDSYDEDDSSSSRSTPRNDSEDYDRSSRTSSSRDDDESFDDQGDDRGGQRGESEGRGQNGGSRMRGGSREQHAEAGRQSHRSQS